VTAILRQNAAVSGPEVRRPGLGSGGGSEVLPSSAKKVGKKGIYSRDPAAELMPAAEFLGFEPDFGAVLEDFQGSPFDPARRRVLGRLAGVFAMDYQGARAEERRFLRRLLVARNAREGYAANRALHLLGVTPIVRRTLAIGVAEARFATGPVAGFLGAVQARVAATTFRLLGPEGREQLWNLLTVAGCDAERRPVSGADRVLERALVLKALAARRHRIGPWSKDGSTALYEISSFAEALRGASRRKLAALTTLIPEPGTAVSASHAKLTPATRAVILARGEVDPIFAWREHGSPRIGGGAGGDANAVDDSLPDLDRGPLLDRSRLHQALAEARAFTGRLEQTFADALTDYMAGRELSPARLAKKDEALAVLAKRGFDVVRGASVEAIRRDAQGVYRFDAARALGDLLSRYSGATYLHRVFSDQVTAGAEPIAQITAALATGFAVPVSVAELKQHFSRAYAVTALADEADQTFEVLNAENGEALSLSAPALLAPSLPKDFGSKARAEAYFAPAALDLLAPPFGLTFPAIGIEDQL
jgi:hypothetical protein